MRSTGSRYENLACERLEAAGLVLVDRNFTCRYGELDLVMRDGDVIVFVEVRYRRGGGPGGFGDGIDSVGAGKRAKLVRAATAWLAMHPRFAQRTCRFDVVAIAGDADAAAFDWRANAFDAA
jgi:putative endonuclease